MSSEDDAALLTNVRTREEALRRKEKEVAKKELQLKEQLEQMKSMRTVMDSALQELEARELVMTDAEAKHGSLLQREEAITRRERDVDSKEETLKERLVEASKREQEAADHFKQRQREYEEKLFPLAAREQELIRREMEAQAMDHDLEIKYKQLNKHIATEEEKEKVRDKTFRDREQVLRDQIALTDRRQQELDQLNTHLTEKQRLLKAEQVENDGRDREIKWREEQLRLAQNEVAELKAKLVKWDAKLVVDDEALRLEVARVGLTKAEVELREAELVEKTSKLLAMDEAIQQRDEETRQLRAEADVLRQKLTAEKAEVAEIRDSVTRDRQQLDEQIERMKLGESHLDEMDARLKAQAKVLNEREKSVKCWIMELQYRESQQASTAGSVPLTSFDSNEIATSTLESIQDKYLAVVANPNAKKGSATVVLPPRSSSRGLLQPLGAPAVATPAAAEASLAEAVDSVALDVKRSQLEARLNDYMSLLYALSNAERKRLFSAAEEEQLSSCEVRHQELVNELQLLWLVLVGKQLHHIHGGATAGKLAKELTTFGQQFTVTDWSLYYQSVRSAALRRRQEVTSLSIARLSEMLTLLSAKLGDDAVAELQSNREDLKKLVGAPRIHHQQLARALPMGRSCTGAVVNSAPPSKALANELPASGCAETDSAQISGKSQRPATKGSAKLADAKAKVVATLPEYLRHHYAD